MKAARNSSFELLRIILIIMILVEHGNMWFIGGVATSESELLAKSVIQSVCIGAVNTFVLISGWFGIRRGISKIGELVFKLMFCTLPLIAIALIFNWLPMTDLYTLHGIFEYVFGGNAYWFIVDYIGLLIAAPLLNRGIEGWNKKQYSTFLIAAYSLIVIFDFVFRAQVLGCEGGYSVLWFIFLYLLARYIYYYGLSIVNRFCWEILVGSVITQSVLFYWGLIGMRYTNPLILLESISLLFIFRKWNFRSSLINYAASGCLMAYMLHMQPILIPFIREFLMAEYVLHGYWLYMWEVFCWSLAVFILAIFINNVQSALYNNMKKWLFRL